MKWGRAGITQVTKARTKNLNKMQERKGELVIERGWADLG